MAFPHQHFGHFIENGTSTRGPCAGGKSVNQNRAARSRRVLQKAPRRAMEFTAGRLPGERIAPWRGPAKGPGGLC